MELATDWATASGSRQERWQFSRKSLTDGLRDALGPEAIAQGGLLLVASVAAEAFVAKRRGGSVAFLATAGFEHWPQMAFDWPALKAGSSLGADERTRADGTIAVPLDVASVEKTAAKIKSTNVGAVAVAFLHARANSAHEIQAASILRQAGLVVVASHELATPEIRSGAPPESECELAWRAIMAAYVAPSLAEERQEVIEALGEHADRWRIRWTTDLEAALASQAGLRECGLHFGLERFFTVPANTDQAVDLRDGPSFDRALRGEPASRRAFSLQPLARLQAEGAAAPAFLFEARGYEPGPMIFGKSLQPTALDVLAWRGRMAEIEGAPSFSNDRLKQRISEALFTIGKAAAATPLQRPDPNAIGSDLEALLVESVVTDLMAAGLNGPFRATGALAQALVPLLALRRPDWTVLFDEEEAGWAESRALLRLAQMEGLR